VDADAVLYVHLAWDGGIFVVRGSDGSEGWVTRSQLQEEIETVRAAGGMLLYSREAPDRDPPEIVTRTFELIGQAGLPIKLLEEPHPSVSGPSPHGMTTLMGAGHGDNAELVADLLDRGADPEARDDQGYTALMYAANAGALAAVEALLSHGADPNVADEEASTPVMFAAQHGHAEIIRRLLDAGADLGARGDHGLTALGFARQNGHGETAALLEAAGGPN